MLASNMTSSITIKAFGSLALDALIIHQSAYLAFASPIIPRHQALHRRQLSTYWGDDDEGISHAGSWHCFHGGTWLKQSDIAALWREACSNTISMDGALQYVSYALNAEALTQTSP